jgi:hypothetical protein
MGISRMRVAKMKIVDDYKAISENLKKLEQENAKSENLVETVPTKMLHICPGCEYRQWVDDTDTAWVCKGCGTWRALKR